VINIDSGLEDNVISLQMKGLRATMLARNIFNDDSVIAR
jgi:hypothetical protein